MVAATPSEPEPPQRGRARVEAPSADRWVAAYVRSHPSLANRLAAWPLVLLIAAYTLVAGRLLPFQWVLAVAAIWTVGIGICERPVLRRAVMMTTALRDLDATPEARSDAFAVVVAAVLHEAHPRLTALKRPESEQVRDIIADSALRLFVRTDLAGCADGHSPACAHRRDGAAWVAWLDPAPADTRSAPGASAEPAPADNEDPS